MEDLTFRQDRTEPPIRATRAATAFQAHNLPVVAVAAQVKSVRTQSQQQAETAETASRHPSMAPQQLEPVVVEDAAAAQLEVVVAEAEELAVPQPSEVPEVSTLAAVAVAESVPAALAEKDLSS